MGLGSNTWSCCHMQLQKVEGVDHMVLLHQQSQKGEGVVGEQQSVAREKAEAEEDVYEYAEMHS